MKRLQKVIKDQRKEKAALEKQLSNVYGGKERGQETEEQMITVMNENRQLQAKLEKLQKETNDIQKFEKKNNGKQLKIIGEIDLVNAQLQEVKDQFQELSKQNQ